MNIVSSEQNETRLLDGINTLLNLTDADFNEVIRLLTSYIIGYNSVKLENINFWYSFDKCEAPENAIQLGLSKDHDENGKMIGRYYFGGERYSVYQIFDKISQMKTDFPPESREYKRITELLNSRNLTVFKTSYQALYNVNEGILDKTFEMLRDEDLFEKFMEFDKNRESFYINGEQTDIKSYFENLGRIFRKPDKSGDFSTVITTDFYIPDLYDMEKKYLKILQRYNLDRYVDKEYEFRSLQIGGQMVDDVMRDGDEPDWEISTELRTKVLDEMPEDLSLEEKVMYIYTKLCKVLKYDEEYFFRNELEDGSCYESDFSQEHLESIVPGSKITCFDFSRVFAKIVNGFEGDIEAVIIVRGVNKGHFLAGFYTDKVSATVEAINSGTDGMNDLIKAKNGLELKGIQIFSDKEGIIESSLKKIYPLVYERAQLKLEDYMSQLRQLPKDEVPMDMEVKLQSFIQMMKEKNISGNEAVQDFMTFEHCGFWGKGLEKFFVGEKFNKNGLHRYRRKILARKKEDKMDTIYVFDTEKLSLEKMSKAEIMTKIEAREYVYEDDKHRIPESEEMGR